MTDQARGRVLVLDDDENMRLLAQWALGRLGYGMVGAETTAAAIDLCREALGRGEHFAAVILDLNLPGGRGGTEALAALRELDPTVPAFVMSGDVDDPRMLDCSAYGFRGAISKTRLHVTLPAVLEEHLDSG